MYEISLFKMNEAVVSYKTALADLTFNSKPLINMLTMLAEESEQMASEIVQVIDDQIDQVFIIPICPYKNQALCLLITLY